MVKLEVGVAAIGTSVYGMAKNFPTQLSSFTPARVSWKIYRGQLKRLLLPSSDTTIIPTPRHLSTLSNRTPSSSSCPPSLHSNLSRATTCVVVKRPLYRSISSCTVPRQAREVSDGRVTVSFTDRDGDEQTVRARLGDNLLDVAREYDIDLEGACDGTLSCSTCHLVIDSESFSKITDPITEEEEDMLDLAYGLTDTSRLGCQVVVTEDLDGMKLTIPMATIDAREV